MTSLKNLLLTGIGVASLALTGCDGPHIKKVGDLTGDSIQDVLVYYNDLFSERKGNVLFVGQKNGKFVKAREFPREWNNGFEYFKTDNGEKYSFDGEFYRLSPKQKK